MRYPSSLIFSIRKLRSQGMTYGEIRKHLNLKIPKSSLSHICRNTLLPVEYALRIVQINKNSLEKGRLIALEMNKIKREKFFYQITSKNKKLAQNIYNIDIGKIALAMLCLGEASKYVRGKTRSFNLGNSDIRIITIFLNLLKECFPFNLEKIRATVQCRADQDVTSLENFWSQNTGIPKRLFYKAQIDPRTKGKPTLKKDYHGVLRVDYFDTQIQLELENLADLIYNQLQLKGPVVYR